jgi:hypothetical protein
MGSFAGSGFFSSGKNFASMSLDAGEGSDLQSFLMARTEQYL